MSYLKEQDLAEVGERSYVFPLQPWEGIEISGPFGSKPEWREKPHGGVDFRGVPHGADVYSTVGGVVIYVGVNNPSAGNYVEVLGDDGLIHRYMHLDNFVKRLESGKFESRIRIEQGETLGFVGNTGRIVTRQKGPTAGYHLHYEVRKPEDMDRWDMADIGENYAGGRGFGVTINPMELLAPGTGTGYRINRASEPASFVVDKQIPDGMLNTTGFLDELKPYASIQDYLSTRDEAFNKRVEEERERIEQLRVLASERGESRRASRVLMRLLSSRDVDDRAVGSVMYTELGHMVQSKSHVGIAADIAASQYDSGAGVLDRKRFYTAVSRGLPFDQWLNDTGEANTEFLEDWETAQKNTQMKMARDQAAEIMRSRYGVGLDGNILRVRSGIESGIEGLGKYLGYFEDDPATEADESRLGWNLATPEEGKGAWWDELYGTLTGGRTGTHPVNAVQRRTAYKNLADRLVRNLEVYYGQASPHEYNFDPGMMTPGSYIDPFEQTGYDTQPNFTRIDPNYISSGLLDHINFDTVEGRREAEELLDAADNTYFPNFDTGKWSFEGRKNDVEGIRAGAFSAESGYWTEEREWYDLDLPGDHPSHVMDDPIDEVLKESLQLPIFHKMPSLPKKLIKEGGIAPLNEGGVAGHMNHLYDNPNLTFRKMKEIFQAASNGELKGTEKTDGQNLQLSYDIQTSTARAARNKGNIKDGGMDAGALAAKFGGRGALETAFTEAFSAFEEAIGRMSIEEREEIFGPNTNIYYNAEVQDPRAANLINYDLPTLTIHRVGHREYDRETGAATERDVGRNAKKLSAALDRVQGERQEGQFHVQMNAIRQLEALGDNTALNLAIARLERALSEAGISDNQTVGEYVLSKVDAVVDSRISLPVETKVELMKRMFKEPGANIRNVLGMIPKEDAGTIAVVRELVEEAPALMTAAVAPIEEIVHDFSVEMLRGLHSAFILDNEAEVVRLRQETSRAITAIEGSSSEEAMEILAKQMSKLKDVEGVSTAAEGFVFDYDDVTYKFTGNFAPMNQLLGLFKYGRGDVPPMQKLDEEEGEVQINRTVAIIPGGFKPPHKGHLAMVEHYSKLADIVFIFISPLSRGSSPNEAEVGFRQSKDIWDLYIQASGLNNVKIIDRPSSFNSPVQMAYEFSENKKDEPYLAQAGDRILFGASEKSDKKGNPDWMRFQNAQNYVRDGAVAGDAAEFASPVFFEGLGATGFRRALHNADIEAINQFIPEYVDSTEILSILGIDAGPEYPIEESSMGGGAVEGGGSDQREHDSLIREEDGIIEEVLNYLLQKRNSND